jgi:ferrous iron transport protein A
MTIPLSAVPTGAHVTIQGIEPTCKMDPIAQRLDDLGFVQGENIQVIARTLFQAGPIAVQINTTRFALRQSEAARILVIYES